MIRWRRERRSVHEDHHGDRHRQFINQDKGFGFITPDNGG
jgi:hypothetical protein